MESWKVHRTDKRYVADPLLKVAEDRKCRWVVAFVGQANRLEPLQRGSRFQQMSSVAVYVNYASIKLCEDLLDRLTSPLLELIY